MTDSPFECEQRAKAIRERLEKFHRARKISFNGAFRRRFDFAAGDSTLPPASCERADAL
jgi:hypothetical protein